MYDTVLYYHCICKEKTFEILWSSNIILVFVNATIKFHFIVMLLCSCTNNLGQFNTKSAVLVKQRGLIARWNYWTWINITDMKLYRKPIRGSKLRNPISIILLSSFQFQHVTFKLEWRTVWSSVSSDWISASYMRPSFFVSIHSMLSNSWDHIHRKCLYV